MKLSSLTLAMVMAASLAGMSTSFADDQGSGVINFKGKIINAPCTIPGDGAINVELGQVANKVLVTGKKYSQSVAYSIPLEDCDLAAVKGEGEGAKDLFPAVSKVKVTFTGTPDKKATELLTNTGTSKGAGVRLINADGSLMKVGDTSTEIPLVTGKNALNFSARVEANSENVETGTIVAQATYALTYL